MCGIIGAINFAYSDVMYTLKRLSLRGRDGIGYYQFDYHPKIVKELTNPEKIKDIEGNVSSIIGNARAIPTTEFQSGAGLDTKNQQPFRDERYIVVHNGLIANDVELIKKYSLNPTAKVDTAILPELFSKVGVIEGMKQLEGSFSILCYDEQSHTLYAGKNFTPMVYVKSDSGILITSIKEMLPEHLREEAKEVPPYSILKCEGKVVTILDEVLYPKKRNKKVLVICSSGIDSTTTAWIYKYLGYDVKLIHFLYGQAAQEAELYCVKQLAKELGTEPIIYDAKDIFKSFAGVSRLLNQKKADDKNQMWDAESTFSYVPNRNAIFAMVSAGVAEMLGCDTLAFGGQQMDSVYPDNNPTFVESVDRLIKYSLNWRTNIKFAAPLIHLIKHEIVEIGLTIGVPYQYVCACYYPKVEDGKATHCGKCGCCQFRYNAFKMLGVTDSVKFKYEAEVKGKPIGKRISNPKEFIDKYIKPFA